MTQYYSRSDTRYNGDVYSIPFSYGKKDEISVYIDDKIFTNWQFLNNSQIRLVSLPSDINSNSIVSVRRNTDISKPIVEYTNNTMLLKENLNLSQNQLINSIQEVYDNNVSFKIDAMAQITSDKADTDAQIAENKQELLNLQSAFENETNAAIQEFEDGIDAKIATVADAADKINTLDESIALCQNSAEIAHEQATIATQKNEEILDTKEILLEQLDSKANKSDVYTKAQTQNLIDYIEDNSLNKTQITNCTIEIPQRIKIEFNNGGITLKKGSILTVPNGFESDGTTPKFNYITINEDKVFYPEQTQNNIADSYLFVNVTANSFGWSTSIDSGWNNTETDNFYYRNDLNKIYYRNIANGDYSFPICKFNYSNQRVDAIEQIFNGMGYIGSIIWVDKDVKGLIPYGRNEDGTLKNIELNKAVCAIRNISAIDTDNIIVWLPWGNDTTIDYMSIRNYIISDNEPTLSGWGWLCWYNPNTNLIYGKDTNNSANTWMLIATLCFTTATVVSGKIQSMDFSKPFRAAEAKDVITLNNNFNTLNYNFNTLKNNALLKSDKITITNWATPDYSAGVGMGFTFTAPSAGILCLWAHVGDANKQITVNGVNISIFGDAATGGTYNQVVFPLSQGDYVAGMDLATGRIFFPYKGTR